MKRAVVTGATSMIGSALVDLLVANGVEVTAIINPRTKREDVIDADNPMVTVMPCALSEYEEVLVNPMVRKMPRSDVFFHLAWDGTLGPARNDAEHQEYNVRYASDAVRLAHALGCTRFVGVGSQAEYGLLDAPFSADTPCRPITAYGQAKLKAFRQTRELAEELGMEHIWARVGSAYGPGDNDGTVIIQAIWHAWHDEPFACTAGEQQWDHIYCEDAAEALRLIGESGKPGAIYPIGTGKTAPLRDHIKMACEVCNPDFEPDFGAMPYPENQVMFLCADISQLQEDTGFEPLMPFEHGVKRTAEWYREQLTKTPLMPWEKHGGLDFV